MKNIFSLAIVSTMALASCGAVQSIVQNTFPYTTNVLVSTGVPANKEVSSTATASNVQTWVGGNNNAQIKDVRISDAKISVASPVGGNLSALKSVKIYISSNGTGEKLVASRSAIDTNSSSLNLDLNDTGFLDTVVKSSGLTVRTVYELKNQTSSDMNLKVALNFSSVPVR
ncbi:hypothetical protein [Chryseobacterium indoltheticum]|uniref:Uncharacterized protein n=1 Tax=Chryseobacterium indoltheticum TaxID=254 RepID=A0A381JQH9_9FLAO|nr:hypothetical protein [Chryseobacterium indoltheticum]AZA75581.1 hypothetical protein EG358_18330 [Chryseobacterium indoltheticum]SIQ43580.1 hypothetical protein SAMN05421682_10525 [Chryseobacterium indoltheticum]SUY53706.1 Uncharacterised protein [Chryseobacterium indoltheticum]